MKINKKLIAKLNPCKDRFDNFIRFYGKKSFTVQQFMGLKNITHEDKLWVAFRLLPKNKMRFAAAAIAEEVLYLYERSYPDDFRPRKAIEEAKKEKLDLHSVQSAAESARSAAESAAESARSAARSAYYAARSAARSARSAARSAYYAARSAARSARSAAESAYYAARSAARSARSAAESAAESISLSGRMEKKQRTILIKYLLDKES